MGLHECITCGETFFGKKDLSIKVCLKCDELLRAHQCNLLDIYNKQLKLQEKLGYTKKELIKNQEFININILAILDELAEAMRETTWKNPKNIKYGWKKTQKFNIGKFQEELVDILHFFINLCIASGMEPIDIYKKYMDKNLENRKRQDKGY